MLRLHFLFKNEIHFMPPLGPYFCWSDIFPAPLLSPFLVSTRRAPSRPSSAFRPLHLPPQLHCPSGFPPGTYWGCSSSLSLSFHLETWYPSLPLRSLVTSVPVFVFSRSGPFNSRRQSLCPSVRLGGKCSPRNANATRALQPPRMEEEDFLGRKRTDSTVDGRTRTDERGASVPKCSTLGPTAYHSYTNEVILPLGNREHAM